MWVMMVQHKTSDQYLISGKVSTRSIHRFKRYRLLKTLTKTFNILNNADADMDADANAIAMATAIALPVLSYRRAKNGVFQKKLEFCYTYLLSFCKILESEIKS